MQVLFVVSEAEPLAKSGGLAEVAGYLPLELKKQGVEARVMLPLHGQVPQFFREKAALRKEIQVPVGWRRQYCGILEMEHQGQVYYLLDNRYYFHREGLYGYYDDAERFAFFSRAALEALPHLGFIPQVLHCHDWQGALVPLFLKAFYGQQELYRDISTVFTIHNLRYQGIFPPQVLGDLLGLGPEFFTGEGLEFYGLVNFMKGGIIFSHIITTVSKNYREEIQYPFYGCQLDPLLRKNRDRLYGIVNGIDYQAYDPMTDPEIFVPYRDSPQGKRKNKEKLQARLGLPVRGGVPLVAIVNRLVEQKGLDLVMRVLEEALGQEEMQLVVLGTGETRYENYFRDMARRFPRQVSACISFDGSLARKIYAGSDIFLMPSLFEPCGIGQLIALRYGSVPLVRETGGLKDTVQPYNEFTGEGNGFSFANYNAHDLLYTLRRALWFYRDQETWARIVGNAVDSDYSWKASAGEYRELYRGLVNKRP